MGRYEAQEIKVINEHTDFISDYTIEVTDLYKFGIEDATLLKETLWTHFNKVITNVFPDSRVYDIQLADSRTEFLDLLAKLKEEKNKLMLIERRGQKESKPPTKKIEKQKKNIEKAEGKLKEFKESKEKPYFVKGFITFTTMKAAVFIKNSYNSCFLCNKSELYTYFFYYVELISIN